MADLMEAQDEEILEIHGEEKDRRREVTRMDMGKDEVRAEDTKFDYIKKIPNGTIRCFAFWIFRYSQIFLKINLEKSFSI